MADAGQRKPIQHAHSSNQVDFGHPGTATYHNETHTWSFLRRPRADHIRELGTNADFPSIRVVKESTPVVSITPSSDTWSSGARLASTAHFLKVLPDTSSIVAQRDLAAFFNTNSAGEEEHRVSLLEFGSALILGSEDVQSSSPTAPVAAYVLAGQLNTVFLTLLDSETVSVDLSIACLIRAPCITDRESAQWAVDSGVIEQIVFSSASSPQSSRWLAVRQTEGTSIFQPLLHRAAKTSAKDTSLDHNHLIDIPRTRTGLLPHADVQFSPSDPSRIAIVDVGGNWSVWKISGTRSRSARVLYRSRLVLQGSFVSQPERAIQFDGWHRLMWVLGTHEDMNYLFIANRLSVALFDETGSLLIARDVRVGQRNEGPILDVLPLEDRTSILVLTAVHVYLISTRANNKSGNHGKILNEISTQMFWSHARNANDISLRFFTLELPDVILLFLASLATGARTIYQIRRNSDGVSTRLSLSDAFGFDFAAHQISSLKILNIQFVATETKHPGMIENMSFFKIFVQDQDESICEILYQAQGSGFRSNKMRKMLNVPIKKHFHHMSASRVITDDVEDDLDGFIVPDSNDNGWINESAPDPSSPYPQSLRNNCIVPRTCDLHMIYDLLSVQMASSRSVDAISVDDITDRLANAVPASTMQTLSQELTAYLEIGIRTVELERDSDSLKRWEQEVGCTSDIDKSDGNGQRLRSSRVWTTLSLLELYESLVEPWLSSLPDAIPDRFRVQRERLLRQVALDLLFSSIIIGPSHTRTQSNNLDFSLSLDRSSPAEMLSADPKNYVGESSAPERKEKLKGNKNSTMLLTAYAPFKMLELTHDGASAISDSILAHLPTSAHANPDEYSFDDAELSVALARNELADQEMDPKAKRKSEKLARARRRQIERQTQMKKVAFEQSTTLPSIMSSQLPIRAVQSSQAGPLSSSQPSGSNMPLLSMTQPERGVYGNRDGKKSKSKGKVSRQKGF